MNLQKRRHILGDLQKIAVGHHVTIISGSAESVVEVSKECSGILLFITDGEKLVDNITTIKVLKSRYKEDDQTRI